MDTASPSLSGKEQSLVAFVEQQTAARLRRLAYELRHTRQSMNEERVHDLRVAIRRLMETLRVTKGVLPEKGTAEVLDDLRKIMKDAGRVRGCDIAADLLRGAGAADDAAALQQLAERRKVAEGKLYEHAQQAYHRNATAKWRAMLMLDTRGGA